jgi:hypothetical protein
MACTTRAVIETSGDPFKWGHGTLPNAETGLPLNNFSRELLGGTVVYHIVVKNAISMRLTIMYPQWSPPDSNDEGDEWPVICTGRNAD